MGVFRSDGFFPAVHSEREEPLALLNIGSMSPPSYPSAWLPPSRARLCSPGKTHCSSTQCGGPNFRFARYQRHPRAIGPETAISYGHSKGDGGSFFGVSKGTMKRHD
jgi:hypothetical protein